jgi:hypothetical protein
MPAVLQHTRTFSTSPRYLRAQKKSQPVSIFSRKVKTSEQTGFDAAPGNRAKEENEEKSKKEKKKDNGGLLDF